MGTSVAVMKLGTSLIYYLQMVMEL